MQMIMLTALFSIMLPPNAEQIMFALMKMSNLDLLSTEKALTEVFHFSETEPFNEIFERSGIQGSNFIIESGTLIFIIAGFICILILKGMCLLVTRSMNTNLLTRRLRKKSNWNISVVRFLMEGCLGLGLVAMLSLLAWKGDTFWDSVSSVMAVVMLVSLILTPVYIVRAALTVIKDEIKDEKSDHNYAQMFEGLKLDK